MVKHHKIAACEFKSLFRKQMFKTELQNGTCSDWSVVSTSDEGLFRGASIYVCIYDSPRQCGLSFVF